jgi:hypothetical protein
MSTPQLRELDKIDELEPAFDGFYGWLTVTELNLLDPNCYRFDVIEEVEFIDGTTFVLVAKC